MIRDDVQAQGEMTEVGPGFDAFIRLLKNERIPRSTWSERISGNRCGSLFCVQQSLRLKGRKPRSPKHHQFHQQNSKPSISSEPENSLFRPYSKSSRRGICKYKVCCPVHELGLLPEKHPHLGAALINNDHQTQSQFSGESHNERIPNRAT